MNTTTAFIGDSHAYSGIIGESAKLFSYCQGYLGLPVIDAQCKKLLDRCCNKYDLVFWSCSTELHGNKLLDKIKTLADLPMQSLLIEFESPNDRFCFNRDYTGSISDNDRRLLKKIYVDKIKYYMVTYSNLVLVPLAARYQMSDQSTYKYLRQLFPYRCVDLSIFDPKFVDEYCHLDQKSYLSLYNLLGTY